MRALLLVATLVGLAVWSPEARACKPFIPPPAHLVGPAVPDADLRVSSQTVALRCREADDGAWPVGALVCALEARYLVHNDGTAAIVSRGVVILEHGAHLEVHRDGRDISAPATAAERARWSSEASEWGWRADGRGEVAIQTFDAAIAAGGSVTWTVHAELVIEHFSNPCALPPIFARHHGFDGAPTFAHLRVTPRLDPAAPLDIDLELPRRVAVEDAHGELSPISPTRAPAGLWRRRQRLHVDGPGARASIDLSRGVRFARGGPMVAAGLDVGAGPRPRLRIGWEFATLRHWWIQSLALESDLRALTLVPTTEVASPVLLTVIPSLGLGLGVPLRIFPEVRAGVRTQLSLGWPRLSLLGTFDVYPARPGRTDLRGGVMLQLGLR